MRLIFGLSLVTALMVAAGAAEARVRIDVNLSSQTMHVSADGGHYAWAISSARAGYATPRGTFRARHLEPMHYSRKYHMSPMPHSIFFAGGYAIHGTYATGALGRPASHGCIRISPGNAAFLYGLVKGQGADIHISGSGPRARSYAKAHSRRHMAAAPRKPRGEPSFGAWRGGSPEGGPEVLAFAPPRM
jgi:hypothetical protein